MRHPADTHILVWLVNEPRRAPNDATVLLPDAQNSLFVSAVIVWDALTERGWSELAVTGAHALSVGKLPPVHGDPFDRVLVAQSIAEGMTLITLDAVLARDPGPILVD